MGLHADKTKSHVPHCTGRGSSGYSGIDWGSTRIAIITKRRSLCSTHPHPMPVERVHLMDNNKSHYKAESIEGTHTPAHTHTYTHTDSRLYLHLFIIFLGSHTLNGLSGNNHSWLVHVACNTDSLPRCHADRPPARSLYSPRSAPLLASPLSRCLS